MVLDEAIIHAREASQREDLCEACREDHAQLADWLDELRSRRQKDSFLINHPECVHQCCNRKNRAICQHCTRNDFAPSGDNKQDYFNQEVDISIFEKRRNKT